MPELMAPRLLGLLAALHRDERGQSAIAFFVSLAGLIMFFALGFDAGVWYFDHRRAQTQTDAAATAAIHDLPSADTTAAAASADAWLVKNGANVADRTLDWSDFNGDGLVDTVRVRVRRQSQGFFSALSGIPFVYVSAAATARIEEIPAPYSLMAMNESNCDTLYVFGGADVSVTGGGGSYARSTCDAALHVQGTSSLVTGVNDSVSGQGETTGAGAVLQEAPTLQEWLEDPYELLPQPVPGPCKPAADYNLATLTPGTYCEELNVNNPARKMAPGVYIFLQGLRVGSNGGLSSDLDNNDLTPREPVLLYNTCPTSPCNGLIPADMRFEGGAQLELRGHPDHEDIVLWVDRTGGCCPGSLVRFRGGSAGGLEGRIYAYHSTADIGGTPGVQLTLNMSIVADEITFQGDAEFDVVYDPLYAPVLRVLALIE